MVDRQCTCANSSSRLHCKVSMLFSPPKVAASSYPDQVSLHPFSADVLFEATSCFSDEYRKLIF